MIVRVCLFVAALAGIVWVGASLQSARLEQQAAREVSRVTAAQLRGDSTAGDGPRREALTRAAGLLRRSRTLAPLQSPTDTEAGLLVRTGQRERGLRLLRAFLDREPENSFAWAVYASLLVDSDPPEAARAGRRVRELDPVGSSR